ncbi:hypothetical protein FPQ18DRAFT_397323 [Pyronema domesticum]|uniref:Uncharacterized protein n=1 Tax=Pyronema omphalodes (strain CBS 100304) TaxID=1076935 RepID=U4LMF6_PYROM|nr:hypothetical protein FPQ18DRAFT_397323 [Pyronema domesticum]CCX15239.1 Protein of unknown function [Pyronema omphalodes CBS 100304]
MNTKSLLFFFGLASSVPGILCDVNFIPVNVSRNEKTAVTLYRDRDYSGLIYYKSFPKNEDSECITLDGNSRKQTVSYTVGNGCCEFFEASKCEKYMFKARNEMKIDLEKNGKKIYSFRCLNYIRCEPNRARFND